MFFEVLIIGATSVFISSLTFAWYALQRQERLEKEEKDPTIEEKRRVLERQREGFCLTLRTHCDEKTRSNITKYVLEIDEKLLDLADEEATVRSRSEDPMTG